MKRVIVLVASFGLGAVPACGSGSIGGGGPAASKDKVAPQLTVTAPDRGTMSDGASVHVTGQVADADSGVGVVTVNGVNASVDASGAFSADVTVTPGIAVLSTIAKDKAGNEAHDVRAVLTGTLAPVGSPVVDALAVKLGPGAFMVIGQVLGTMVGNMDLTAPVGAGNPVYSTGGSCLGVKVDVERVDKGPVTVGLLPAAGHVNAAIGVANIDVKLHASYHVACIGGSSTIHITASQTTLTGQLGIGATSGHLSASVDGVDIAFQNFNVDVSGLPGVIVDLLQGYVNDAVSSAVRDAVKNAVPGLAQSLLAELDAATLSLGALGKDITVAITPQTVAVDDAGLFAVIQSGVTVSGGTGAEYLSTPSPADAALMGPVPGLGIGIADDLVNQLLAGLWASGALEQQIPLGADSPAAIVFGDSADHVEISLALPPTVAVGAGGDLQLVIGDLMVKVVDASGGTLAELAVSMNVGFSVELTADGRFDLTLGTPTVQAQILSQSDALPVTLTEDSVSAMVGLLAGQLAQSATSGLGSLPIPAIGDATLENASIATRGDFLVLQADLVAAP